VATIEVAGQNLVVHIHGADRILALESQVVVPLVHIAGVESNPPEAHDIFHGLRMGGTNVPGVITAGRFVQHGEWSFWDVHDPNRAIEIRLHDEAYGKLVIGVDDPEATVAAIKAALANA
jgi:hypothetical protein